MHNFLVFVMRWGWPPLDDMDDMEEFGNFFSTSNGWLTTSIDISRPKIHLDKIPTHCKACVMVANLGR
jgi:hypothetical protein